MSAKRAHKSKSHPKGQCEVEGCTRPAVTVGLCSPCYVAEIYWTKHKSVADRRKRRKNLEIFQERMDRITMANRPRRVK